MRLTPSSESTLLIKGSSKGLNTPEALQLEEVIGETDTLMARFRGLLRISELEDHQRRSGFLQLDPLPLLQELYDFYLPLAEEGQITLILEADQPLPSLVGDRALLFEALSNLLSNSIKFTPPGGEVILRAINVWGLITIVCRPTGACCLAARVTTPGGQ